MYLLVANFQNYHTEQTTFYNKEMAVKEFERVKNETGAQSAFLYKQKTMRSWVR